jgi:hypothetical protein
MIQNTYEVFLPLTAPPYLFVGRKPVAVLFGEERMEVKSWREVYSAILTRCNENPQHHEMLMVLRDKVGGKCRTFLSGSPEGMTRPLKIAEGLYEEVHYGSATLIHILVKRILSPVGFNCSDIGIMLKGSQSCATE